VNKPNTLEEILEDSAQAFSELAAHLKQITEEHFFQKPANGKWSIAQHLQHLIIATRTATAAYILPKFLVRLIGGKPNRPSRSYDELVQKYLNELKQGGRATGRYIPQPIPAVKGKATMMAHWQKATGNYIRAIRDNWTDNKLDHYVVRHPLLGKITLRELGYFIIYHTRHHQQNINPL
jgi:uncharacterized damage-inducible protein DinB